MAFGFSMTPQSVVIFQPTLDKELNNPNDGLMSKYLRKRGRVIVGAAKRQVGVQTGALRQSIHMRQMRDGRGQYLWIGSENNHAYVHHQGTKPHLITPNEAKILRFTAGSRIIYTHSVMHPGTRANRYLSDQLYLVRM